PPGEPPPTPAGTAKWHRTRTAAPAWAAWNAPTLATAAGGASCRDPAAPGRALRRLGSGPIGLIAALVAGCGVPVARSHWRMATESYSGSPSARREPLTAAAAPATMGVALEVPPKEGVYHWRASLPFARSRQLLLGAHGASPK